jgi:hypothetical protein
VTSVLCGRAPYLFLVAFRAVDLRAVDLRAVDLRAVLRADDVRDVLRRLRRDGTFAPFSRASSRPIAIACLRLLTVRPEPLLSVPRLRRRIVDSTFFDADLPYFAMQ